METLPDRSATYVCKLNCHLCPEVQELIQTTLYKYNGGT
jgi:hypothetical protein